MSPARNTNGPNVNLPELQRPRILIVDDEAPQVRALCDTLGEQGYETVGSTSPVAALDILRGQKFDLLLTDLTMPGMNGIDLLIAGQQIDPNIVGIIMTGEGTISTAVEAMKSGAFDYVLKPFKLSVILPVLARALTVRNLRIANAELERDVRRRTELLEAETAKRLKVEQALHQAQKMEAIGQLTGGIAHDFNNILQIVIANLDLIARQPGGTLGAKPLSFLETAIAGAERGASLVKQLLAFGRRQPLAPERFDVNDLIARTAGLLRRTLGEKVVVETVLTPAPPWVLADAHQFESALLNLAVNARDAMRDGGRLSIATDIVQLDKPLVTTYDEIESGHYVRIAVADTGTGMTPGILFKAIEPFFTTKKVGEGSGLGLSQVYGYVKQSGGYLDAQSAPGNGTEVALYLPVSLGDQPAAKPTGAPAPALVPQREETVLVVEDEKLVQDIAVEAIKGLGYRVLAADDAAAALGILKGQGPIDILFSDVVMPGMNGYELAVEASRIQPAIRVLLASGYTRAALATDHGLDATVPVLQKPYRIAELAAQLRAT
jgi:signal transduction histidine kinase